MDKDAFTKMMQMIASESDSDAVMGLRGLQGLLEGEGVGLAAAVAYALDHLDDIRAKNPVVIEQVKKEKPPVTVSGMPQCRVVRAGCIEIIPPGKTDGALVQMQGAAAEAAENIAFNMKDVLVAAVINKSRFKLKVVDIKGNNGLVIETILRAEYERDGMTPVQIWANVRGEVAALATLMRKGMAAGFPELMAA